MGDSTQDSRHIVHIRKISDAYFSNATDFTATYFQSLGKCHDLELHTSVYNIFSLTLVIFNSHWGHLSIIFIWLTGILFHVGWNGNFEYWITNPVGILPIGHSLWDLNFQAATPSGDLSLAATSGVYYVLLGIGVTSNKGIYSCVLLSELASLACLVLSQINRSGSELANRSIGKASAGNYIFNRLRSILGEGGIRLNYHISVLFGLTSILWSGHIVHCAIPASRGSSAGLGLIPSYKNLMDELSAYDSDNHVFGASVGSGTSVLTFLGGFSLDSLCVHLSDISHHHLALGVLLLWGAQLYKTFYKGIGSTLRELSYASNTGLRANLRAVSGSLHLQLSLALFSIATLVSGCARIIFSIPAYPYLALDSLSSTSLFVHHSWIYYIIYLGSFAHLGIYFARDYRSGTLSDSCVLYRLLSHKATIISHLSWVSLWLGFHVLGIFLHNDSVLAFGRSTSQLVIEPFFDRSTSMLATEAKLSSLLGGILSDKPFGGVFMTLCGGDVLACHAVSFAAHVTLLIILKGSLDATGSRMFPDKAHY